MAKNVTVNDLRERVQLLRIQWKTDEELNRKEYLLPVAEVFAYIYEKSSGIENTNAGFKQVKRLQVAIRKNTVEFEYIKHKNNLYKLISPVLEANAFCNFEAEGIVSDLPVITEYPEIAR